MAKKKAIMVSRGCSIVSDISIVGIVIDNVKRALNETKRKKKDHVEHKVGGARLESSSCDVEDPYVGTHG